jgi:opacity protein-like surface antigen
VVQPAQKTQTTQAAQKTQTTQAAQISQNTQTTHQAQQVQSNQAVQPNNQPPAKQHNNFPEVQNIFSSQGAGKSRRKWYRGIIEAGYGFGLGDYGNNNFRFNFINAIKIGEFSSIGLGIGYRRLFTDNTSAPYLVSDVNQIPVFLDLRTSFSTRRLTPYLALGIGGSSGSGSSGTDKALLLFNASGGIWYNFSPRFAVFAGIAYEMQKLNYSDTDPFTTTYNKSASSISLNIGISF